MRIISLCLITLTLVQCGNYHLVSEAKSETDKMHWDRSYLLWEQIYSQNPNDTRARIQMKRSALYASLRHLEEGLLLLGHNSFDEAQAELQFALKYDPNNQAALDGLKRLKRTRNEIAEALSKKVEEKEISAYYPKLTPNTWEPIDLYFPRPTKIRDIYQTLGRNYGINILMSSKIKGEIPNLDLKGLNFLKALDTLMVLNRHFFKVIDEKTMVIFTDDRQNKERYSNQVIKTYYLSNATPKDMAKHLKIIGDFKTYSENEELNAITIKGTPEQIAMADRIISANDKAQAEVIVEVELLEVNKNVLRDMGIQPVFFDPKNPTSTTPMYQAGLYFNPQDGDGSQIQGVFPHISSSDFMTVLPSVMIKLLKENSDSKQISNPHVRVTAGKQADIKIGQSVPVASTAFVNPYDNSSNANTQIGDRALTTFSYKDAGIEIKLTPRVHHNQEITLEFSLSVISVIGTQALQPIFGQRVVNTTIRLKNGEASVLAGLLSNDERQSLSGFPGLSDIPILGKLFSSEEKVVNQTDIILLLKPVIVRDANISPQDRAPYEISTLSLSNLYSEHTQPESSKESIHQVSIPVENNNEIPSQANQESYQPESVPPHTLSQPAPDMMQEEESGPGLLAFMPGVSQIRVDEPIELQLFMTNISRLYKGEVVLSFDPELIQVEGLKMERLPVAEGRSPKLMPFWDQESGRASVIITPVPGSTAFSGSGILTNLTVRGLKPGTTELKIVKAECQNPNGELVEIQTLTGEIQVVP